MKTVRDYMTEQPFTVGREQTMARAHELMREHRMRHLPVLHGGRLVGIVSERDLHLVEGMPNTDPSVVRVEEAMTADPWEVAPEMPVAEAAQVMADKRFGAAIVVEKQKVVGIFTTIDALRALVDATTRR